MGIETAAAALFIVAIGAQAVGEVAGGITATTAAEQEADRLDQQAQLINAEAQEEALRVSKERERFRKKQKLAFLKSGVTLAGSPLLILEETKRESAKEVEAIRRRGRAGLFFGQLQARQTKALGRSKLIGSIVGTAGSTTTSIFTGKTAGIF